MQTWYALFRTWGDWDETPGTWCPFGLDPHTGHPIEFLGSAADALRQLEDELQPTITGATRIERNDRRLLLVKYDQECGGEDFVEYRLVDCAQRRANGQSPRTPASSGPAVDRSGALPNRFLHEFQEVAGDVPIDLDVTLAHLDADVGSFVGDLLLQMMALEEEESGEIIRNIMSLMLWIFMMGREHGGRGYPAPLVLTDGDERAGEVLAGLSTTGRRRANGELAWLDPVLDAAGNPRSSFGTEFHEVAGDVVMDYSTTMLDLDEEVGLRVNDFVVQLIHLAEKDAAQIVLNLLSGAHWMFRLGREHAIRGYSSPVPRGDSDSWIPDNLDEFFDSNG